MKLLKRIVFRIFFTEYERRKIVEGLSNSSMIYFESFRESEFGNSIFIKERNAIDKIHDNLRKTI